MARQMRVGSTSRQIDLGKDSGRPAMMTTELERAGAERRSLYHQQRWLRVRRQFLSQHPLCIECEREGLVVAAVVVDHRDGHRHRNWRERFWDQSRWDGLCIDHHNRKSAAELAEWTGAGGAHRRDG